MALAYTLTSTVTTAAVTSGYVRLLHGTLACNLTGFFQNGISGNTAFWCLPNDVDAAWGWAVTAEQQLMFRDGPPNPSHAIVAFDAPLPLLESFKEKLPDPWMVTYTHGYKFMPVCFPLLNEAIINVEITISKQS
jgi:hypothetical protein